MCYPEIQQWAQQQQNGQVPAAGQPASAPSQPGAPSQPTPAQIFQAYALHNIQQGNPSPANYTYRNPLSASDLASAIATGQQAGQSQRPVMAPAATNSFTQRAAAPAPLVGAASAEKNWSSTFGGQQAPAAAPAAAAPVYNPSSLPSGDQFHPEVSMGNYPQPGPTPQGYRGWDSALGMWIPNGPAINLSGTDQGE